MNLTPEEFAFADVAVTMALLAVMAGLGWTLFVWLPRKWREAGQLAERLATLPPRDCEWCASLTDDGLTIDDCECTDPCDEYRSWCAARRPALRQRRQQ